MTLDDWKALGPGTHKIFIADTQASFKGDNGAVFNGTEKG